MSFVLHRLVWKYCLKRFIQVIDGSNLMVFICFVLLYVFGKVIVLKEHLVSWSWKDILHTYKMIAIQKHWYAWQLVYSHDVIGTNDNFHFLGTGEKRPPVFLRIEVALLNKYLNQNININNLFTSIKIWTLSSNWLATLPSRRQYSRGCGETLYFHVMEVLFFWAFFSLFVSL